LPGDDWYWTNDWEIVIGPDYDPQGWRYADSFSALEAPGGGSYVREVVRLMGLWSRFVSLVFVAGPRIFTEPSVVASGSEVAVVFRTTRWSRPVPTCLAC
jgi:hypothetical protein